MYHIPTIFNDYEQYGDFFVRLNDDDTGIWCVSNYDNYFYFNTIGELRDLAKNINIDFDAIDRHPWDIYATALAYYPCCLYLEQFDREKFMYYEENMGCVGDIPMAFKVRYHKDDNWTYWAFKTYHRSVRPDAIRPAKENEVRDKYGSYWLPLAKPTKLMEDD